MVKEGNPPPSDAFGAKEINVPERLKDLVNAISGRIQNRLSAYGASAVITEIVWEGDRDAVIFVVSNDYVEQKFQAELLITSELLEDVPDTSPVIEALINGLVRQVLAWPQRDEPPTSNATGQHLSVS